ncbi:MAG: hypothetical protein JWR20_1481, partial [Marmoricola sp.]|nr:hypothetical protein [Marmoricola sp.]
MSDDLIRLAVLIDADNTSPKMTREMFEELAGYGTLTVKRAYGDWTNDRLRGWKGQLHKHAISPIQQFANTSGKNATDSALIIDAMDLLYAGHLDGFVIVSSDADFTRLATRLRESGKVVYGVGQRKTPKPFQDACDKFTFLEVLRDPDSDPDSDSDTDAEPSRGEGPRGRRSGASGSGGEGSGGNGGAGGSSGWGGPSAEDADVSTPAATAGNLQSKLTKALNKMPGDDDNWATLGALGNHLNRTDPSFDPRTYDFAKLSDLVKAQPYLETKSVQGPGGRSELWARIKGAGRSGGQPGRDQSGRDQSGRDQSGREQSGRDQSGRDQSGRDQTGRDQSGRGQAPKDQAQKDQASRDEAPQEQPVPDRTVTDQPADRPAKELPANDPSPSDGPVRAGSGERSPEPADRAADRPAPVVKVTTSSSEALAEAEAAASAEARSASRGEAAAQTRRG